MSYASTFIRISPDSARTEAVVPPANPDKPTVASLQYERLSRHPGELTEQELQFKVHCLRNGIDETHAREQRDAIWTELFARPQACLRASPLPKTYGWGLHYDENGRIRLVGVGTADYQRHCESSLVQTSAMRSKRAQ